MDTTNELEEVRSQREERIAQLETRLRKPRSFGVRPELALVAMLVSGGLLWMQRLDVAYLFSSSTPIVIGRVGEYDFSRLASNRYAQIQGVPTVRGTYFQDASRIGVVVGLRDTPVLVARPALDGEEWKKGTVPAQPDQRPFTVGGRLLSQTDSIRFKEAFPLHAQFGEISPKWVLIEGEQPGRSLGTYLSSGLLTLLLLANAYFMARGLLLLGRR
ncbi:MAG: hypothetical protein ACT4TC_14150 [Myxococcaceae bacterium]